nr:galectin-7-like isoform X2 [Loxodonta africana]
MLGAGPGTAQGFLLQGGTVNCQGLLGYPIPIFPFSLSVLLLVSVFEHFFLSLSLSLSLSGSLPFLSILSFCFLLVSVLFFFSLPLTHLLSLVLLGLSHPLTPLFSQTIPHKTSLPQGIHAGTVLRIRGLVPHNAGRFHVNLLCSEGQDADAALHFNPRMDTSEVVFNSKEQGAWGPEERGKGVPFYRGQPFEVLLIATDDGFKAVVGDSEYHVFRHRMPLARVRLLEVGGDVQLESVRVF